MHVIELILKFLRLKALEVQDWTERKLAATKASLVLVFLLFLTPFLLAAITTGFDPSDRAISTIFGICVIPMIILMIITVLRVGVLAGALYGLGVAGKKIGLGQKEGDEHKDHEHAKKAFTGLVFRKVIRAFAWMTYVYFFYMIVPVWRDFVWYMGSIALVSFVTFYVLGYPEDNKPEYRKRLLFAAIIGFMTVVMVSTGAVRWTAESGEAAWEKLPSIMLFSTAAVLLLVSIVLVILAPLSPDGPKASMKIASKIAFAGSVATFTLVLLFGDMNWWTFRQGYGEVKAVPRTVDAIEEWQAGRDSERSAEVEPDSEPASMPESDGPIGQVVNEALPPAPPEPSRPSAPSQPERVAATMPEAEAPRQPVPAPEPVRIVQTAHQGDEFDKVTDLLDRSSNHRAAAGL